MLETYKMALNSVLHGIFNEHILYRYFFNEQIYIASKHFFEQAFSFPF